MIAAYSDPEKQREIIREPMAEGLPAWDVYVLEQVWDINLPQPYKFLFWQPWLKGYNGAMYAGIYNSISAPRYLWMDQELKAEMGH
jgi:hypothetical protein